MAQSEELYQSTAQEIASTSGTQKIGSIQAIDNDKCVRIRSGERAGTSRIDIIDALLPVLPDTHSLLEEMWDYFDHVELKPFLDKQTSIICSYIAIHASHHLKYEPEWTPGYIFDGDRSFIRLCNAIIGVETELDEPKRLSGDEIASIIVNLDFVEKCFECSAKDNPTLEALSICERIKNLRKIFKSPALQLEDLEQALPIVKYLRMRATEEKFMTAMQHIYRECERLIRKTRIEQFDEELVTRELKKPFYGVIAPLLECKRPDWFDVFTRSGFMKHLKDPGDKESVRVAVVNTNDWPGQHWFAVSFKNAMKMDREGASGCTERHWLDISEHVISSVNVPDYTRERKRKPSVPMWFEPSEDKNTYVYVQGLPPDIGLDEFKELMSKYGIIMLNPHTLEPKVKLYKDADGNLKGDGLCCYWRKESVVLAMQFLDDTEIRGGYRIKVQKAEFKMKGRYDPKKKPKMLSKKEKLQIQKKHEKYLDWEPVWENGIKKSERVLVFKNMFHPKEFVANMRLIAEIRDDLRAHCEKFGEVKKVLLFDRNEDGICSVAFKDHEDAAKCQEVTDGLLFHDRKIDVSTWDGFTNYHVKETDRERGERMQNWEKFLNGNELGVN